MSTQLQALSHQEENMSKINRLDNLLHMTAHACVSKCPPGASNLHITCAQASSRLLAPSSNSCVSCVLKTGPKYITNVYSNPRFLNEIKGLRGLLHNRMRTDG